MKLRSLLLFILLLQGYIAFSETITVISNADFGPGTLRDAINRSNVNGNTEVDLISFNMPGTSLADHTIKVLSDFPEITTDVIIDGSTQTGDVASVNHAMVIIDGTDRPSSDYFTLMKVNGVNRFELYGIVIRNFLYNTGLEPSSIKAIEFFGINKNVVIGAPGKGNVLYNIYGISVNTETGAPKHQIQSLTMKSNILGLKENGVDMAPMINTSCYMARVYNLFLGGDSPEEGNLIFGSFQNGIAFGSEVLNQNAVCSIKNNIFVANKNGERQGINSSNPYTISIAADADVIHTGLVKVDVMDNVFGCSLSILGLDNAAITIARNFFGTFRDRTKPLPIASHAVSLRYINGRVLFGGITISEGNVVANANNDLQFARYEGAVIADEVKDIELSHNSFYCNPNIPFLYNYTGPFAKPLDILLNEKTDAYVAGTTEAGARVELYYTDLECTNCQPKRYFAVVTADANGKWRYDGPLEIGYAVMALATVNSISSEFSDPRIYMFDSGIHQMKVTHQTCDIPNGKIEGAFTVNVNRVEWLNEAGELVGNTMEVGRLEAGKYRMKAHQFGCTVYSKWIVVEDNIPKVMLDVPDQLIHPSCGNMGSIVNIYPIYYSDIKWLDKDGKIKGTERDLINVPAGSYMLQLTGLTGCVKDFGPYVLVNSAGPSIDQSAPDTKNSICNTSTGYIKNIHVTGTGTLIYKWKDASGTVVGFDRDLIDVPAGSYILEVKDNGSCPALVSMPIIILETDGISIDATNISKTKATCNTSNGSITGVIVIGATEYKWLDEGNNIVGYRLDLTGKSAGKYRLLASNEFCNKVSEDYVIELAQSAQNYASTKTITSAQCNQANGKIEVTFTMDKPVGYRWQNSLGEPVGGNSSILESMFPGAYDLYITDDLGCEQFLLRYVIPNIEGVIIHYATASITNDRCSRVKGQIKAPRLTGGQLPYFYEWEDKNGELIGTSAVLDLVKAGEYKLTVGDALACSRQTISYTVMDESVEIPIPVLNDVKICSAGNAVVQVMQVKEGMYAIYDESNNLIEKNSKGIFSLEVKKSQVYSVVLQHGRCQSLPATVKVSIENDGLGPLVNAFSPNGDGQNDEWLISGIANYPNATVAIYNRYGHQVFESTGYKTPFNGQRNGAGLPVGTYYYIIDLKRGCGLQKGSLTLVR